MIASAVLSQAAGALRHDRRRALLTMLGMAWGIATVVLLLSYGNGFERALLLVFGSFGGNSIGIFPGRTSLQAGGMKAGAVVRFTEDDVDRLVAEVPAIKRFTPMVAAGGANVQYENRIFPFEVRGVYPAFQDIRKFAVASGRGLSDEDEVNRARVAVIGDEVRHKLFFSQPAIGESIRILGVSYTVVGVFEHKVQGGDGNDNSFILTPYTSFGAVHDTRYLSGIWVSYEGSQWLQVEKAVRASLAVHHGFKAEDRRAVGVANIMEDIHEITMLTTAIKVLLTFIGLLTLGIGGVSLMNIMLVAVTQRTREIGVEKALGARRRHILVQFLAEALAITFAGGVLGVMLAYAVSWTVGSLTLFSAFMQDADGKAADIHLTIQLPTLLIATAILVVVGTVCGMLPAIKAARLDPIEALRYE